MAVKRLFVYTAFTFVTEAVRSEVRLRRIRMSLTLKMTGDTERLEKRVLVKGKGGGVPMKASAALYNDFDYEMTSR